MPLFTKFDPLYNLKFFIVRIGHSKFSSNNNHIEQEYEFVIGAWL